MQDFAALQNSTKVSGAAWYSAFLVAVLHYLETNSKPPKESVVGANEAHKADSDRDVLLQCQQVLSRPQ